MKEVAETSHLQRRGNIWHYYRRIPTRLIPILGKTFVKRSLNTESLARAKQLRTIEDLRFDALKAEAEAKLANGNSGSSNVPTISLAGLTQYIQTLVEDEDKKAAKLLASDPPSDTAERDEMLQDAEYHLQILNDPADPTQHMQIAELKRRVLKAAGGGISDLEAEGQLNALVRRAVIELARRRLARYEDDHKHSFFDQLFDPASPPTITFADLADAYLKERMIDYQANGVSDKRLDKVKATAATLLALVGSAQPIASVDDDVIQRVRNDLARLPANRLKLYPKLTVQEAIARGKKEGRPVLDPTTQAAYIAELRSMLALAVRKKWISHNPADGIRPLQKDSLSASQRRLPLSIDQIVAFFTGTFYRSCATNALQPYTSPDREWRFWIPLVMLFCGARPNEICQLHVGDLKKTANGVWYLDLVIDGSEPSLKTLKTETSRRKVPLHQELVRLGFVSFVEQRAKKAKIAEGRLFPELKPNKYGNVAWYVSRRMNEKFLPAEITLGLRQSLYSLRHSVRDALRRVEAPADALLAITGWAPGEKSVADDYGDPGNPDIYKKWVDKIDYTGLDLSFLYPTQG